MPVPVNMTSLAQSVAGLSAAERRAVRPANSKDTDKPGAKRGADEVIIGADAVEGPEAARRLASNGDEESHQDRQQHEQQPAKQGEERPRLDISG